VPRYNVKTQVLLLRVRVDALHLLMNIDVVHVSWYVSPIVCVNINDE